MDQERLQRLQAALFAAHDAGDTAAAGALAAEIIRSKGVTVPGAISAAEQVSVDPISRGAREFNKNSSFGSNALAGSGKAFSDIGLGARQITGFAPQSEVDERRKLDAPLMDTAGGMTGNIGTQIGMALAPGGVAARVPGAVGAAGRYALSSPATLGGAATQGALGAIQGGLQPVATGESRAANMAISGGAGAAVPVAGMALGGLKGAVEPLYAGGREKIIGRALRGAAGDNAESIISNLRGAKEFVPGSAPTAGEAANSGGIAALQRTAAALDPEAYATRAAQQNEARVAALDRLSGSGGRKAAMTSIRDEGANEMYAAARALGVDQGMAKAMKPQVQNLMDRMPSGVLEKAKELARLNGEAMDGAGSVNGLHWMKLAVDDMLSAGKQTGIGSQTERGLVQFKNDLLSVVDELSPAYGQARKSFAEMSQLPNQMEVAGEIADKSVNKLTGNIQPQAYARALTDDTAARATGFNKATLANTMEPEKLAQLQGIKDDLARSVQSRDMGRGPGSDTVQKLSMSNLMEQAGLPMGMTNLPGVGRFANWTYSGADDLMRKRLSQALLNPSDTAALMQGAGPNVSREAIIKALRSTATPAAIGGSNAMLNLQQ